jgi:hypothetical protein
MMNKFLKVIVAVIIIAITACTQPKEPKKSLKLGFGKADLTQAAIFEDPLIKGNTYKTQHKYDREEKFAISDRVKGRWRAGSGIDRKLVDSLTVEAMYGEDENGPWTIVTFDECFFLYELMDSLEKPLVEKLNIPKDRIVFLPSHGHTTIKMVTKKYANAVYQAVNMAKNNMQDVEIATLHLTVDAKTYQINRRIFVDGIGTHNVMFNDYCIPHEDYLDATGQMKNWLHTLGMNDKRIDDKVGKDHKFICDQKVDNKLQTILIRNKESKEIIGSFTRYASHAGIVSAKMVNGDVSPDFPGHLKNKLEKELGGIALFAQGPSGDLRPLHKEYSHEVAREYGEKLADNIINAEKSKDLKWESLTSMNYYTESVNIPLMDNIFISDEEVEKGMDEVENKFDNETDPHKKRLLQNDFWRLYRTDWTRNMVRPEWKESKQLQFNLCALKLNDETILSTRGEIFSQLGADMVGKYDDKVILTTISNEYVSYFLPDFERERGGYTASVAINKYGTTDSLIVSSQRLLNKIYPNY